MLKCQIKNILKNQEVIDENRYSLLCIYCKLTEIPFVGQGFNEQFVSSDLSTETIIISQRTQERLCKHHLLVCTLHIFHLLWEKYEYIIIKHDSANMLKN